MHGSFVLVCPKLTLTHGSIHVQSVCWFVVLHTTWGPDHLKHAIHCMSPHPWWNPSPLQVHLWRLCLLGSYRPLRPKLFRCTNLEVAQLVVLHSDDVPLWRAPRVGRSDGSSGKVEDTNRGRDPALQVHLVRWWWSSLPPLCFDRECRASSASARGWVRRCDGRGRSAA
jgi:hypothetical protein